MSLAIKSSPEALPDLIRDIALIVSSTVISLLRISSVLDDFEAVLFI